MKFPLSPDDFLPIKENESKVIPFDFKGKPFTMKVSCALDKQYFVEIIPEDKAIKNIGVGYDKDLHFIWSFALQIFEQRFEN
jgi:hypothetical protein